MKDNPDSEHLFRSIVFQMIQNNYFGTLPTVKCRESMIAPWTRNQCIYVKCLQSGLTEYQGILQKNTYFSWTRSKWSFFGPKVVGHSNPFLLAFPKKTSIQVQRKMEFAHKFKTINLLKKAIQKRISQPQPQAILKHESNYPACPWSSFASEYHQALLRPIQ